MLDRFSRHTDNRILLSLLWTGLFLPSIAIAATPDASKLAEQIVKHAGIPKGLCAVLGADGELPIELSKVSELLVHVRDPDPQTVTKLRKQADLSGCGINRLVIDEGNIGSLPYADNMIDVVVMTQATKAKLLQVQVEDVLRILRPHGVAIIEAEKRSDVLTTWVGNAESPQVETLDDDFGSWIKLRKPIPDGIDDWSHWRNRRTTIQCRPQWSGHHFHAVRRSYLHGCDTGCRVVMLLSSNQRE